MKRFHILKDGTIQASTTDKEEALYLVRMYQSRETHPFLRAQFSIIEGEEEYISYK